MRKVRKQLTHLSYADKMAEGYRVASVKLSQARAQTLVTAGIAQNKLLYCVCVSQALNTLILTHSA